MIGASEIEKSSLPTQMRQNGAFIDTLMREKLDV